jgi:hypothetical protein
LSAFVPPLEEVVSVLILLPSVELEDVDVVVLEELELLESVEEFPHAARSVPISATHSRSAKIFFEFFI